MSDILNVTLLVENLLLALEHWPHSDHDPDLVLGGGTLTATIDQAIIFTKITDCVDRSFGCFVQIVIIETVL
jgi:hypothetical protein